MYVLVILVATLLCIHFLCRNFVSQWDEAERQQQQLLTSGHGPGVSKGSLRLPWLEFYSWVDFSICYFSI